MQWDKLLYLSDQKNSEREKEKAQKRKRAQTSSAFTAQCVNTTYYTVRCCCCCVYVRALSRAIQSHQTKGFIIIAAFSFPVPLSPLFHCLFHSPHTLAQHSLSVSGSVYVYCLFMSVCVLVCCVFFLFSLSLAHSHSPHELRGYMDGVRGRVYASLMPSVHLTPHGRARESDNLFSVLRSLFFRIIPNIMPASMGHGCFFMFLFLFLRVFFLVGLTLLFSLIPLRLHYAIFEVFRIIFAHQAKSFRCCCWWCCYHCKCLGLHLQSRRVFMSLFEWNRLGRRLQQQTHTIKR